MNIKPIPLCFLRNTAIYKPFIREDRESKVWGEEIELKNISLSYTAKYSVSGESQYMRYNAVLFYDCVNSLPKEIVFKEQDLIIHENRQMVVERVVIPNWTKDKPHHYELELFDSGKGS